jgi:predicted nucleotidyltransferase
MPYPSSTIVSHLRRNRKAVKSRSRRQQKADTPEYYTSRSVAVAAVAERAGLDLVVLFGSAARGQLRPESDVDIAVRFTQGKPGFEAEVRVAGELHEALRPPRELDLVVLNGASPLLLAQVAAEGLVLYAPSPEIWPRFWLYARRRFEDTEKYRRRHWESLKQRVLG